MSTAARHLVWIPALAALALIGTVLPTSPLTTYGGASPGLAWTAAAAAVGLLVLASLAPDRTRYAALALAGATWTVPELAGWAAGPEVVRTIADAWARLLPALVLVGVSPGGAGRLARRLGGAALVAGTLAAAARLLLVDPFEELDCWRSCDRNPVLVAGAGRLGPAAEALAVLVGTAATLGAVACWSRSFRRRPLPTLAAAAFVLALAAPAVLRLTVPESASAPYVPLFVAAQTAALVLACVIATDRIARRRLRSRLTRLAGALTAAAPVPLTAVLRTALRDPELTVLYRAPGRDAFVDAEGRDRAPPAPGADRRLTTVVRRSQPIAAVVHRADVDGERLERALGPALRLALENEQLRAVALAELAELQRSRARILERAVLERRRLERNLHDGAQQRLVSLALLVRMLSARVEPGPQAELVGRAATLARVCVEDLRRLARGIYPAVLADAGLAGAVLDLAESSTDVAVRVLAVPARRYERTIETTGYLAVAGALADARSRGATCVDVRGEERSGVLLLDVHDDAPGAQLSLGGIADEVDALRGRIIVRPRAGANGVRLELPCGS